MDNLFQCLAFPYVSLITEAGCEKRRKMAMQGWRGSEGAAHCLVCERNPAKINPKPAKPENRGNQRATPEQQSARGKKGGLARAEKYKRTREGK